MAYELYIERNPAISLEEWRIAVSQHPALQYGPVSSLSIDGRTDEMVVVRGGEGDVSMAFEDQSLKLFRWHEGHIIFSAGTFDRANDPIVSMAWRLAKALGAVVRSDDVEVCSSDHP